MGGRNKEKENPCTLFTNIFIYKVYKTNTQKGKKQ